MKQIYLILLLLNLTLLAGESYWDIATKSANSLWDKTKQYTHQGKNIAIEKTVLNGINAITDNSKIKVEYFGIDDRTNYIDMVVFLKGEDKKLNIKVKDFSWGISTDKQFIVFENLDISLDITWLNYLLIDKIKRDGGRLVIPNKTSTFSLLYAVKPNIKIEKELPKKEHFDVVYYEYNKDFFHINKFEVKNHNISTNISIKGSKNNILCSVSNYTLRTANRKNIIVLQDIKFQKCNKPWIQSVIEKQNNEVHFDFNWRLYILFGGKK